MGLSRKSFVCSQLICMLAISFFITTEVQAGAWARQKGHFYTKLNFIYLDAPNRFDENGTKRSAPFSDRALYFYGEYGLTNSLTIQTTFPITKNSTAQYFGYEGTTRSGFAGDYEFSLKYQFFNYGLVAALQAGIKQPVGYDANDIPPLGTTERDFETKLLLGTSLYPLPAYTVLDFGYRSRGGAFENEINYNFEFGYTLFQKYMLRVLSNGIFSTGESESMSDIQQFAFAQDNVRVGGGLIYFASSFIELDVSYFKTISGKNYPAANEIYFGVAYKY